MLYQDIHYLYVDIYHLPTNVWQQLVDAMLDMLAAIPVEDRCMVLGTSTMETVTKDQIIMLFTRLLWYVICEEYAQYYRAQIA